METSLERVTDYYRRAVEGHVYLRDTLAAFFEEVGHQIERLGPRVRVLELGSHAGFISEPLISRWPQLDLTVTDEDEGLVGMARERLAGHPVRFHCGPLETLRGSFDIVLSVARHHHLPHGYLGAVRELMTRTSVYCLADELCPEYGGSEHRIRLEEAKALRIDGGYVFTSAADWEAFERDGTVLAHTQEFEQLRRRALWRWYRFVVDHAVALGYFDIAASELQSARDDLVTGSEAEHKFSPTVVEREFALAGFRQLSKRLIGPADEPEHQSLFVYAFGVA